MANAHSVELLLLLLSLSLTFYFYHIKDDRAHHSMYNHHKGAGTMVALTLTG